MTKHENPSDAELAARLDYQIARRRRPARQPMTMRAVRVPDDLWEEAHKAALAKDEAVSDVIRAALTRYVAKHRREQRNN